LYLTTKHLLKISGAIARLPTLVAGLYSSICNANRKSEVNKKTESLRENVSLDHSQMHVFVSVSALVLVWQFGLLASFTD